VGDGFCRLCRCQGQLIAGHGYKTRVEQYRLLASAGQQLFLDNTLQKYLGSREDRRRQKLALPPSPPIQMPRHAELVLFDARRDLTRFDPNTGLQPDNPQVVVALSTAGRLAEHHGWTTATRAGVERGLGIALSRYPIGNPVRYSELLQLQQYATSISVERTADVLAELGRLLDDRPDTFHEWLTTKLSDVPSTMRAELWAWIEVLQGKAPRSRPRSNDLIRNYTSNVLPHVTVWAAGRISLREILDDDVAVVLRRYQGHERNQQLGALRSLFSTLKRRRLIFRNPTEGFKMRQIGPENVPPPLPDSVLAAVAEAAQDPVRRLLFILAALHARRPFQMRQILLAEIDLEQRQLAIDGRPRPLDPITYGAVIGYLKYRRARWPVCPNPHLLVSKQTAYETGPVSATWPRDQFRGLPTTLDRIRMDRYLEELLTHGPDPLHCQAVFGASSATAVRYAAAAAALRGTTIQEAFKNRPAAATQKLSHLPNSLA
jgi:hypothetical protein